MAVTFVTLVVELSFRLVAIALEFSNGFVVGIGRDDVGVGGLVGGWVGRIVGSFVVGASMVKDGKGITVGWWVVDFGVFVVVVVAVAVVVVVGVVVVVVVGALVIGVNAFVNRPAGLLMLLLLLVLLLML